MKRILVAGLCLLVAGCAGSAVHKEPVGGWQTKSVEVTPEIESAAKEGLKHTLKDPDSAKISISSAFDNGQDVIIVCGSVNAKNSYGGYVGSSLFEVSVMKVKKTDGSEGYLGFSPFIATTGSPAFFLRAYPMCK